MNNTMIVLAVLLVGCSTELPNNVIAPDAGFAGDGGFVSDAWMEMPDAQQQADGGVDAAELPDSGVPEVDGGSVGDHDGGTDASTWAPDSGAPVGDSGPDAAVVVHGAATQLGVSGDTTCVLTAEHQMWCWGGSFSAPTYVSDAVELEGTCAIALDGHVFCVGSDFPGTDATVVGGTPGTYVRRADGVLVAGAATWTPPAAIDALPAPNCGLFADGHTRCWDVLPSLGVVDVVDLYAAVDVARAGDLSTNTYRACTYYPPAPAHPASIRCFTSAGGTTGSTALANGTEIEMAGGRVCTILTSDTGSGASLRTAGVYCASDMPSVIGGGYHAFNSLPAADPVGAYTNLVGTDLRSGQVMCWGDGSHRQLGGAATTRTPVTVF